jgi:hypothetical protein
VPHSSRGHRGNTTGPIRFACWIPKPTSTHPQYVILNVFPLPQWLQERVSLLRYTYSTLSVLLYFVAGAEVSHAFPICMLRCVYSCMCSWGSTENFCFSCHIPLSVVVTQVHGSLLWSCFTPLKQGGCYTHQFLYFSYIISSYLLNHAYF